MTGLKYWSIKMSQLFLITSALWISSLVFAAEAPAIKSFKEWKSEKINLALQQTLAMRNTILKSKALGTTKNTSALEKQLSQLNWNLEVAQDLSVTDYFVLYLSLQPQKDRFKMAASKLTTLEVADLMQAYAQSLSNAPSASIEGTSSSNFTSQALITPEGAK